MLRSRGEASDFSKRRGTKRRGTKPTARNLRHETYGTVAVFEDLYGNQWDLLQLAGRER